MRKKYTHHNIFTFLTIFYKIANNYSAIIGCMKHTMLKKFLWSSENCRMNQEGKASLYGWQVFTEDPFSFPQLLSNLRTRSQLPPDLSRSQIEDKRTEKYYKWSQRYKYNSLLKAAMKFRNSWMYNHTTMKFSRIKCFIKETLIHLLQGCKTIQSIWKSVWGFLRKMEINLSKTQLYLWL